VEEPVAEDTSATAVALPFAPGAGRDSGAPAGPAAIGGFPGFERDGGKKPHFQVEMYAPWRGKVAVSDGRGNMYVYNPATGGYCLSNFRMWWSPRRLVHEP
jgi:hypothetical protein